MNQKKFLHVVVSDSLKGDIPAPLIKVISRKNIQCSTKKKDHLKGGKKLEKSKHIAKTNVLVHNDKIINFLEVKLFLNLI